jgi:histidinol dehydrogenase
MPREPRVRRFDARSPGFAAAFAALTRETREDAEEVDGVVRGILADIRAEGDDALIRFTRRFDRFEVTAETLAIDAEEIDAAISLCDAETLAALRLAAARIEAFHARQRPIDEAWTDADGIRLGWRWNAIGAVGLYVPGGTASYPSSVLMNAIPAKVAGVERVVMTVPTPDGILNPLVLAAARIAGITEIYRVGGAQAIAALAFGTATIRPVDKIVGPGNAYVAAAKRQVFGIVGIESIAGPSEILVVADGLNRPSWIAADLLSQAEHDAVSRSILITDDADFADAVEAAVEDHLEHLPRESIARRSWLGFGGIILVPSLEDAPALANALAPEHLELAIEDPEATVALYRNAGSIFLGRQTPEAIGDYVGGPNHVLPTSRTARFSSGLGVGDFMKRSTLLGCDAAGLARLGPAAMRLAGSEGLDAHALSIRLRLGNES